MNKSYSRAFSHALRLRCPACGQSKIFEKGYRLRESCGYCGLKIRSRDPDTWFFMYSSTAALTGLFIILLFLLKPFNPELVRFLVTGMAILAFFLTMPVRKSLAVAIDYLL